MGIKKLAKLPKRKIGLALSSGAARGLAHIGVLDVLEKEGIPIDMIAGTSMGALIGALYAQGKSADQIKDLAMEWGSKRFSLLADPALPKTGLVKGRKIKNMLKSIIGDIEFGNLKLPFACVATDINSGEEVVIKQGLVWEGVMASVSIPIMFTVAKRKGKYLVDGGLVNPVPASVVREMGADFIIAMNMASSISGRLHEVDKEPSIFNVIMQTINISSYRVVKQSLLEADVVIEPQVESIGYFDFQRVQECILQGELAAKASMLEIKRKLKSLDS
ncbi:MAG: patatin-like phospholipase family protein [Chloroflexi bacterium]|nr:patatin-like phospholipase family protein [Chloroflexota bacterium]